MENNKKIVLIQQYYISNHPVRQKELDTALQLNIENPLISNIYLLNETIYDVPIITKNPKITQINIGKRLTYKRVFEFAQQLDPSWIKILSNSDISFDYENLLKVYNMSLENKCLALTRHDVISYTPFTTHFIATNNSQDTWIFTKIEPKDIMDFALGCPGCDNYIAWILANDKYEVVNNSLTIKTYHHHQTQIRNWGERVNGYYLCLGPTL